jgi:hypothetical protein
MDEWIRASVLLRGIAPGEAVDLVPGAAANAWATVLVTRDKDLLAIGHYGEIQIVTADEFLAHLEGL